LREHHSPATNFIVLNKLAFANTAATFNYRSDDGATIFEECKMKRTKIFFVDAHRSYVLVDASTSNLWIIIFMDLWISSCVWI